MLGLLSRKKKSNEIININPKLLEREGIRKFDNNKFIRNFKFGIDKYNISILPEKKKNWTDKLKIDKIILINLENQPEKLLLMKYKLSKIEINFNKITVITGINGYQERKCQDYFEKIKNIKENKINSIGAIGLLETYKQKIINLEINHKMLILEDDVCFHQDFLKIIDNYKTFDEYDIVYLGYNIPKWNETLNFQKVIGENLEIKNFDKYVYGAYGYLINKKVFELLKLELENEMILLPIDVILNQLIRTYSLNVIAINPAIIIPVVSSSINMGKRNQITFLNNIKQEYRDYQDLELSQKFMEIYINYFSYNLNLRNNHHNILREINNLQLAKLIENHNKFFCVIITSYNNEEWIRINLDSVRNQTYPHWRIIYYNDNSEDNTLKVIEEYIKEFSLENKIHLINNTTRNYQAYGRWISYQQCDDDEICVLLDGDDWFYNNEVLDKLNQLYLKKDYLVTYGGYHIYLKNQLTKVKNVEFPPEIIENKLYRKYQWISFHLRTGLAKLFKSIPLDYLKDKNGDFIKCVTDWAEMFWILERSQGKNGTNDFESYVYNKEASLLNDNSYYNREKDEYWKNYRTELEEKYRNFTI